MGIYQCESTRALLCCSRAAAFDVCISRIIDFLFDCGYPRRAAPTFDATKRARILHRLADRGGAAQTRDVNQSFGNICTSNVYFVLPYSSQALKLKIRDSFKCHVGSIIPIELRIAWTVKPNAMRKLYRLNWPCKTLLQGNG